VSNPPENNAMTRLVVTALVLAVLPPGIRANEIKTRLIVRPMAAPKPVLKYQLLPELRELHPGNAAHDYL
jgi:hypothetical protein